MSGTHIFFDVQGLGRAFESLVLDLDAAFKSRDVYIADLETQAAKAEAKSVRLRGELRKAKELLRLLRLKPHKAKAAKVRRHKASRQSVRAPRGR